MLNIVSSSHENEMLNTVNPSYALEERGLKTFTQTDSSVLLTTSL